MRNKWVLRILLYVICIYLINAHKGIDCQEWHYCLNIPHSKYEPLRQRARKIVQEERIHEMHADGWVRRLAKAGGAVRSTLVTSLNRLWDETLCWFGPEDDLNMQPLYREGIIDAPPDDLRHRSLQKILPTLSMLDIDVPVIFHVDTKCWELRQSLSWNTWDRVTRRKADGSS